MSPSLGFVFVGLFRFGLIFVVCLFDSRPFPALKHTYVVVTGRPVSPRESLALLPGMDVKSICYQTQLHVWVMEIELRSFFFLLLLLQ